MRKLKREEVSNWKKDPVTKIVFEILADVKQIVAYAAVETPMPEEQVWLARGKVEQINTILEGDMFESYYVDSEEEDDNA